MKGYTYGSELSGTWQATDFWKLNLSYGYLEAKFIKLDGSRHSFSDVIPHNQVNLRSSFDIAKNVELDFWLRYVDKLADVNDKPVSNFTSLNLHLGYKPLPNLELSLVGNNLIERHIEFNPDLLNIGNNAIIGRHYYLKARFDF